MKLEKRWPAAWARIQAILIELEQKKRPRPSAWTQSGERGTAIDSAIDFVFAKISL